MDIKSQADLQMRVYDVPKTRELCLGSYFTPISAMSLWVSCIWMMETVFMSI
jgi:hypothetical protein